MKFHKNKFLTTAAAVALMLAVGACSSSSDDDEVAATAPTVVVPVDPVACEGTEACLAEAMTNLEAAQEALVALEASDDSTLGEVAAAKVAVTGAETALTAAQTAHDEYIAMQPPPVPSVLALFGTAQDSKDAAAAAAKAAEGAVEAATEAAGKLTTLMVKGDSMTATTNAEAVLGAQITAVEAATNAETALQDAEDALEDAAEHAADNASLIAALDAAIIEAEKAVVTATDARDSEELMTAVEKVSGNDPEAKGYPMTPAQHGKAAAMDVGGALMPNMDGGRITARAPHGDTAPAGDDAMNAVKMSDQLGHTWAQIVGADNLSPKPLGTVPLRATVMVASIAGMTAAEVHIELTAMGGENGTDTYADGDQTTGATYNGIDGTAYCLGADCKVEDAKLTGSWYFTPDSATAYYRKVGTDTDYTVEIAYAQFGHWLSTVANGANEGAIMVNTYARTADTEILPSWTVDEEMMLTDTSATYSGDAVGMSVHKTSVDGEITSIYSGAFTADVTLEAEFSADTEDQMLSGTVDNFQGNAVDPDWTVELREAPVTVGGVANTVGVTVASGENGVWSASSYGAATARPVGIFGGFNAHFSDGHAAGAYATRK